jgi:hypothetical protein
MNTNETKSDISQLINPEMQNSDVNKKIPMVHLTVGDFQDNLKDQKQAINRNK